MKKLFTVLSTILLAGSLAFAQTTGGSDASKAPATGKKTTTGAKKGAKKAHKGGKKSKKGSNAASATQAPK